MTRPRAAVERRRASRRSWPCASRVVFVAPAAPSCRCSCRPTRSRSSHAARGRGACGRPAADRRWRRAAAAAASGLDHVRLTPPRHGARRGGDRDRRGPTVAGGRTGACPPTCRSWAPSWATSPSRTTATMRGRTRAAVTRAVSQRGAPAAARRRRPCRAARCRCRTWVTARTTGSRRCTGTPVITSSVAARWRSAGGEAELGDARAAGVAVVDRRSSARRCPAGRRSTRRRRPSGRRS